MSEACTRWAELSDLQAVGHQVSPEDAVFLSEHASSCDACGHEAALYGELGGLFAPEASRNEHVEPQDEQANAGTRRSHMRARGPLGDPGMGTAPAPAPVSRTMVRPAVIAAAAVLALAASLVVYLSRETRGSPSAIAPQLSATVASPSVPRSASPRDIPPPTPACVVALLEGDAKVLSGPSGAGALLGAGAQIATGKGRACVHLEPGVRVCLASESSLRVVSVDGPQRVLRLERGHVAAELDPQPAGTSFSIAAGEGSVTAIGTAFSVELLDGKPIVARVSHGVVVVRDHTDERRLHAHEALRFGEAIRALPMVDEDADRTLLRAGVVSEIDGRGRLTLESTPSGAAVELDGTAVGATPLDLLVAPGTHALRVAGSDGPSSVEVSAGEHVVKSWVLGGNAYPSPSSSSSAAGTVVGGPTADQAATLLSEARASRSRGDTASAARAYRALLSSHPASPEATAATLSLAELELGRGANTEALSLFDRYLSSSGPLTLEARYGRIQALTRLGRAADARSAREAFLRDYPNSPQADALSSQVP
jgi:ferric-dicitrate binding protein FerR (iron transport regulator)